MIPRKIENELLTLLNEYPVVTVLGPRQAGKTTLVRHCLKSYEYSNLENPETREFATSDPKGYLAQFKRHVILDEIQRVPELLSYIQVTVDDRKGNGQFILTGSHQLELRQAVSQSLAGRTALLHLLPLSMQELSGADIEFKTFSQYCFNGFLPRIHSESQRPSVAYSNYTQTYVERDVRQLISLKDVSLFEKFIKLVAGRVGQVIDYTSLSNDIGVSVKTVKGWLSILEASFILFKLPPYYENFGKRVIKSPKYYFTDVGLLCFMLGIKAEEQVSRDPLVGAIFENLVVLECVKARYNQGEQADLYFFRDSNGNEVDILFERGRELTAIEVKSAQTFSKSHVKGLKKIQTMTEKLKQSYLVYSGNDFSMSDGIKFINFKEAARIMSLP